MLRLALLFLAATLLASAGAFAHSAQSGDIAVGHIWAYPGHMKDPADGYTGTPGGPVIDIYGPFLNGGAQADAVTGVGSKAARAALLMQWFKGNQRPGDFPLALPPKQPVALSPQGTFIRLYGMDKIYGAGGHFPVTFKFAHAPPVTIDVMVQNGP